MGFGFRVYPRTKAKHALAAESVAEVLASSAASRIADPTAGRVQKWYCCSSIANTGPAPNADSVTNFY